MRKYVFTLIFFTICAVAWDPACADHKSLVLVSGSKAVIRPPTNVEVRKLFLGRPISNNKETQLLVPFRNLSNSLLHEVFLQKIMFLSERSYDRHLISKAFRLGGVRPKVYQKPSSLIKALNNNINSVSYMWAIDAKNNPNIKVVIKLWDGPVD